MMKSKTVAFVNLVSLTLSMNAMAGSSMAFEEPSPYLYESNQVMIANALVNPAIARSREFTAFQALAHRWFELRMFRGGKSTDLYFKTMVTVEGDLACTEVMLRVRTSNKRGAKPNTEYRLFVESPAIPNYCRSFYSEALKGVSLINDKREYALYQSLPQPEDESDLAVHLFNARPWATPAAVDFWALGTRVDEVSAKIGSAKLEIDLLTSHPGPPELPRPRHWWQFWRKQPGKNLLRVSGKSHEGEGFFGPVTYWEYVTSIKLTQ